MRKLSTAVFFGFSGCIAVIAQTLLFREMMVVFQGNELSVGIILSCWLAGTAVGSRLGGRFRGRISTAAGLRYPLIAAGCLLPVVFLGIRFARPLLSAVPGMGLPLGILAACSVVLFVPFAMIFGFQFGSAGHIRTAYLFEAAGYLAGGLIFTYLMLPINNAVMMVLAVCAAITVFTLLMRQVLGLAGTRRGTITGIGILIALAGLFFGARGIDTATLARGVFPGCTIIASHYSPYGHTVVAERNAERYVFFDGIPLASYPDDNAVVSESFAHIPSLFHHRPKTALVIGSAAPILPYLARDTIEQCTYIEIDPALAAAVAPGAPVIIGDARTFLTGSSRRFDLIYINLPYPTSVALNRYYTVEFFRLAKAALNESGVLAFKAPGSLVYLDTVMTGLNYSLWATARAVFPEVRIVPGDDNIFLACAATLPPAGIAARRITRLAAPPVFLSRAYLRYAFNPEKTLWLYDQFKTFREKNYINRDLTPQAMTRGLMYWQSVFAPDTARVYETAMRYAWIVLALLMLWLTVDRVGMTGTAFSSGAVAMGLYMAALWGLQTVHGSLYYWIGMASALFMAGTAGGAALAGIPRLQLPVLATEILFAAWTVAGYFLLATPLPVAGFAAFAAGTGLLLGYQFPLLARRAGVAAYTADAVGASLAALVFGTLIIPAWGIPNTLLVILALKLITLQWWLTE